MGGADVGSRNAVPLRVIPEAGQVSENVSHSPSKESWNVLHKHPARSKIANDERVKRPEPPRVSLRETLPGDGDGLARESAANKVNGSVSPPSGAGSHVVMPGHLRPVLRQHTPAPRINLHLADDGHPGALEAEVEAADAGEQGQDVHDATSHSGCPWTASAAAMAACAHG